MRDVSIAILRNDAEAVIGAIADAGAVCVRGVSTEDCDTLLAELLQRAKSEGMPCDYWRDGGAGVLYLYSIDSVPDAVPEAFRPAVQRDSYYAPLHTLQPGASHTLDAPAFVAEDSAKLYRWVQRVRSAAGRISNRRGAAFITRQQGATVVVRCLFDGDGSAPRGRPEQGKSALLSALEIGQSVSIPIGNRAEGNNIRVIAWRIADRRGVRLSCQAVPGAMVVSCTSRLPDHAADLFE